jgi:hypothetical protein
MEKVEDINLEKKILFDNFGVENLDKEIDNLLNDNNLIDNINQYKDSITSITYNRQLKKDLGIEKPNIDNLFDNQISEIYVITFPNGKQYVGSCHKRLKDRNYGVIKRFKNHLGNAIQERLCTSKLLKLYLLKYYNTCKIEKVLLCSNDDFEKYEDLFMIKLNTLMPNGLNYKTNGTIESKLSTISSNRNSEIQHNNYVAKIIQQGSPKIKENGLPLGLQETIDSNGVKSYRVKHFIGIDKSFCSKLMSNEEKKQLATNLLQKCNEAVGNQEKIEQLVTECSKRCQLSRERANENQNTLPKYLKARKRDGKIYGYEVYKPNHPSKSFCNSLNTLEENLSLAIKHLQSLN